MDTVALQKSKRFCMMPWVHLHVWPAGTSYPCCMASPDLPVGDTGKQSIQEIWNGEKMRTLRQNMLADKPSAECRRCYELEDAGMRTLRNHSLDYYPHHFGKVAETEPDGSAGEANIAYLDIRFSNLCNLRCRTCGPQFSSSWYKDHVELYGSPGHPSMIQVRDDMESFWKELAPLLDGVEEVYFAGGEPLISAEHYRVLEHWLERGKTGVKIGYTTNFTQTEFRGRSVFEFWKKFKNVRVAASLDANHLRGEYIRKNLNWERVVENRRKMQRECPDAYFEITPTVSVYNAMNVADFHREWVEEGLIDLDGIRINILLDPEFMRVQILPPEAKLEVERKIRAHLEWLAGRNEARSAKVRKDFENLIGFMNQADRTDLRRDWRHHTKKVDKLRGESVYDTFPELRGV